MIYAFQVFGPSATKGSTRSFIARGTRRVVTLNDNRNLPAWTKLVQVAARWARVPLVPKPWPITIRATWYFVPPKRDKHRSAHTTKPDLDKLARALGDSLTRIAYEDDAQIVQLVVSKVYGANELESCDITIEVPDAAVALWH